VSDQASFETSCQPSALLNEAYIVDDRDKLARLFGLIAVRAGRAIMEVRAAGASARAKGDGSPVTEADLAADEIIRHCLERNVPELPVITEETCIDRADRAEHRRWRELADWCTKGHALGRNLWRTLLPFRRPLVLVVRQLRPMNLDGGSSICSIGS